MSDAPPKKILVVDDQPLMVRTLEFGLRKGGYAVYTALSGREALSHFHRHRPDLVLLDVRMPEMDGLETCDRLRELSDVPVIMITGAAGEREAIEAWGKGVDGFVNKPVSIPVLLAQIGRVLEAASSRAGRRLSLGRCSYDGGRLVIDPGKKHVEVEGRIVSLAPLEFKLLEYLAANRGQVLSQDQILQRVWEANYDVYGEVVKVYVSTLRQKIEADPQRPRYIVTRRGFGYMFAAEEASPGDAPARPLAPAL